MAAAQRSRRRPVVRLNPESFSGSEATDLVLPARWMPFRRDGKWNLNVRELVRGKNGVYAIREATNRSTVLYVGETHTGGTRRDGDKQTERLRWWKTILRHFYDASGSFRGRNEWSYKRPHDLEIAVWKSRPDRTREIEDRVILEYEPLHTRGFAPDVQFEPETIWETDSAYSNPRRPPKKKKPGAHRHVIKSQASPRRSKPRRARPKSKPKIKRVVKKQKSTTTTITRSNPPRGEIQSVIVSRKHAKNVREARALARRVCPCKVHKVDRTRESYRFRQLPPSRFRKGSFRTAKITDAVSLVYGRVR